jgi:putative component of membrane protein insertase Oxa1/YidC/SpoIIIJ protein YidD
MKRIALTAIRLYQRFLSPLKGFSCAYGAHTGRASCSWVGLRAIRRYGVRRGIGVLRQRLHKCGVAHRRHHRPRTPKFALRRQAGFCDLPCDAPCHFSCDFSGVGDAAWSALEFLGNCGSAVSPCDCCNAWPWDRKRKEESDKTVYIPPNNKRRDEREPRSADKQEPEDGS